MFDVLTRLPRWARLAAVTVASRLLALGAMMAGSHWPTADDDLHWVGHDGSFYWDQVPIRALDVWGRWDTTFYWHIARFGYPAAHSDGSWVYHAAYYPLFPSMMRGVSVLFGLETYYAGVLLAFGLFALAIVYFDRLLRLDEADSFAERAVLVLLCWPGSHFLTCVYPESTTLFLAVFAVYNARTGRPLVAGLACMLAAIARASGVFVCVPVLIELLRRRADDPPGQSHWVLRPRVLVLALPSITVAFWLALNQSLYADPIYFMHVQAGWGRKPAFFLSALLSNELTYDYHVLTLLCLALTIYGFVKRERLSHLALATLNIMLPLSTGMMHGIHRYMDSNYPLHVFLTRWLTSKRAVWAYVLIGNTAMAIFAFRWGMGRHPN